MNATTPAPSPPSAPHRHGHGSPVVAFMIGFSIILLASILNAAGLNLTKLDHVRTSAVPKASRRHDWARPLWLLGMLLYILSQLIGSTLALEYMRAEYVAPLGSSSLVFNFLFARFLVGTPVTSTDIYGTVVVVCGVIGIVLFGSINSGLAQETDVAHLTSLWRRGGWLGYFFFMAITLSILVVATGKLDVILTSRTDLGRSPLCIESPDHQTRGRGPAFTAEYCLQDHRNCATILAVRHGAAHGMARTVDRTQRRHHDCMDLGHRLGVLRRRFGWRMSCLRESDKNHRSVKLISGAISHENTGNQFGHAAPIFTILLLGVTAVMQITCLNRGLKVYDSTLVVPVFYGVYTATGFLDSLIFNNEVDAYQSWALFLIFVSIFVLVSGVVLLTHKKPEPGSLSARSAAALGSAGFPRIELRQRGKSRKSKAKPKGVDDRDDEETIVDGEEVLWRIGDASDEEDAEDDDEGHDEDVDHHQHPLYKGAAGQPNVNRSRNRLHGEEGEGLLPAGGEQEELEEFAPPLHAGHPFRDTLEPRHR
ncbi:hypothetical protein MSAN_00036900 [Mycena sanguinolenta]|uniref:Uncharacterized protein n=1 Tax=Mycena sanguinolenta TaxID=230812 RepID=A0A8H6ZBW7_9AGAR|nr:hypothetical protein MSAN_00036900 [Mycena sanguinolenta]